MKSKTAISSVKWNQKNRVYLEKLMILDSRTGKVRKNGPNLNKFINQCITLILETGRSPTALQCTTEELTQAWIKHQVAMKNKEIEKLTEEIIMIANLRENKSKTKSRMEIIIEDQDCRMGAE